MHFVIPALSFDGELRMTLDSLLPLTPCLGRIIIIAPSLLDIDHSFLEFSQAEILIQEKKGVYSCFNQGIEALSRELGYVMFLGSGDRISLTCDDALRVLAAGSDLIVGRVLEANGAIDPTRYRRLRFPYLGDQIIQLPHHQAMMYKVDFIQNFKFPTHYVIYGDVEQRTSMLRSLEVGTSDFAFSQVAPPGLSSYSNIRGLNTHFIERLRVAVALFSRGEYVLGARYWVGLAKVLTSSLSSIRFSRLPSGVER